MKIHLLVLVCLILLAIVLIAMMSLLSLAAGSVFDHQDDCKYCDQEDEPQDLANNSSIVENIDSFVNYMREIRPKMTIGEAIVISELAELHPRGVFIAELQLRGFTLEQAERIHKTLHLN